MKCPHCLVACNENWHRFPPNNWFDEDADGRWLMGWMQCPECNRVIVRLQLAERNGALKMTRIVWPHSTSRAPLRPEVPETFATDYREACLVLTDSPKASAALSRRCLQHLLREKGKNVRAGNLSAEIDQVLPSLPSHLASAVDAIRQIGNFAAHPNKGTNTGEIIDVEPGEAEWLLDVLEGLFDFYFVQPAILDAKRKALDKKLADAGKPPMKG